MEEKKLTDKQILTALEKCLSTNGNCTCTNCNFYTGNGYEECIVNVSKSALKLIHSLQAKNEGLLKDYYSECETCDEQKDIIAKKKAEIERLTEEKDKYQKKWHTAYMNELNLQKQVDELKVYLASEKVCSKQAVKDTAKGIYKEIGKGDILVVQTQEYGEIEVVSIERLKEIIKSKGVKVES